METKRRSTLKGAVLLAAGIIILAAVAFYLYKNPNTFGEMLNLAMATVVVLGAVVLIFFAAMALMAVPMYAYKGEQYQEGVDYEMNDIKSVGETSSDKKKHHH